MTPIFPALNYVLYESTFQGQLCMLTDSNKKPLYWGDMYVPCSSLIPLPCCSLCRRGVSSLTKRGLGS